MRKCLKCAEEVPDQAIQCPWCGSALSTNTPLPQQKNLMVWGIVIGGIVLLLLIMAIISSNSDSQQNGNQENTEYQYFYDLGRSRAKYYNVGDEANKIANFQRALQELPIVESVAPDAQQKKDAFIKGWTDEIY